MAFIRIENGAIYFPRGISQRDREVFDRHIRRVYTLNRDFWGFDVPLIRIRPVYTRKAFDKEWGGKTERWQCAMANQHRIVVFAPSVFERLTCYKLHHYGQHLAHEVNHSFYEAIVHSYKPVWLMEGLAMVFARQGRHWRGRIDERYLFYTYRNKGMKDREALRFYRNSYLMTERLLKANGRKKVLAAIRAYAKDPDLKAYARLKELVHT